MFDLAAVPQRTFYLLALSSVLLLVGGCDAGPEPPENVSFDAVVLKAILGEGPPTFVLDPDGEGRQYFPLNLPAEFQEAGTRVRVEGLLYKETEGLLMPLLEIIRITRIVS